MKNVGIALLLSAASLMTYAGSPRCAGSYEPAKCEAMVAELAAETPQAKAARIKRIEDDRARVLKQVSSIKIPKENLKKSGVRLGMSPDDAIASSWGKPQKINRTTNRYGVHEQWVYGGNSYLYFEDGVLTSISN